jgi:hypothetical protein
MLTQQLQEPITESAQSGTQTVNDNVQRAAVA